MGFNKLIFHVLQHDTTFKESGQTVALSSGSDKERILTYPLAHHLKIAKDALGLPDESKLCDLIYDIAEPDAETPRMLFFVEVKGSDTPEAGKQINSTITAVRSKLGKLPSSLKWSAVVFSQHIGSSPKSLPSLMGLKDVVLCTAHCSVELRQKISDVMGYPKTGKKTKKAKTK